MARRETERPESRNGAPHRRKGRCAGQQLAVFTGVEARKELLVGRWARCGVSPRYIDETDGTAPIQPPHQRNLAAAKRAAAIVPDSQFGHHLPYGDAAGECTCPERRNMTLPETPSCEIGSYAVFCAGCGFRFMYDLATYLATEDLPGGPIFIEEELVSHSPKFFMNNLPEDDRPLTRGRAIGGVISLGLLLSVAVYFVVAV